MEPQRGLFHRYPQRQNLLPRWETILVITLIISSLSACAGQPVHSSPTPASNHQAGATASPPTQTLQQTGPDSGLYIAHLGDATPGNESGLYKVDYQSGKVLWKYQFKLSQPDRDWGNYAPPFDPIVQQGMVFVESSDPVKFANSVYAITAATGHLVWSYTFDSRVVLGRGQSSRPKVSQGIFYITGIKEKSQDVDAQALYALDARTGKLLHTYPFVRGFAIQDNMLFTSDIDSGPISAINLKNGQVLWKKTLGKDGQPLLNPNLAGEDFMAPFVLQNKVYFRANDQDDSVGTNNQAINQYKSSLYVFDTMNGQQLWHSPTMITAGPVADLPISDRAYVSGVIGDSLSAYDGVTNGRLLWSRKLIFAGGLFVEGYTIYATYAPAAVDSMWGYPPQDPYAPGIMSLDSVTGSPIWQRMMTASLMTDSYAFLNPGFLVHKSMLFINQRASDNTPETFQTMAMNTDGKVLWQLNLGGYSAEVLVP